MSKSEARIKLGAFINDKHAITKKSLIWVPLGDSVLANETVPQCCPHADMVELHNVFVIDFHINQ